MKKLPRNEKGELSRYFEANGNKYRILDPTTDGITIDRYTKFQQMSLVAGYNTTFAGFTKNIDRASEIVNNIVRGKNELTDLILHLAGMKRGIVDAMNNRFDLTFAFCTIFIVREKEDLTSYDEGLAEEKVADWNAEGYDVQDFFLLSRVMIESYKSIRSAAKQELITAKIIAASED